MLVRRLPWVAVLVTLATAVLVLFGPLWDDARGENPLDRPSGVDWEALLRLGLPTVMVAAALLVALALPRRPVVAGLGVLIFGYAVVQAPAPLPLWFLPALVLTVVAFGLGAVRAWRGRPAA